MYRSQFSRTGMMWKIYSVDDQEILIVLPRKKHFQPQRDFMIGAEKEISKLELYCTIEKYPVYTQSLCWKWCDILQIKSRCSFQVCFFQTDSRVNTSRSKLYWWARRIPKTTTTVLLFNFRFYFIIVFVLHALPLLFSLIHHKTQ